MLKRIGLVCQVLFTVEYGLKLATAPRRVAFVKAPANVVDLLAVAPFWLELIVQVCVEGIRTGKQSQDENGEGGVSGEFILILVRAISVTCFLNSKVCCGRFGSSACYGYLDWARACVNWRLSPTQFVTPWKCLGCCCCYWHWRSWCSVRWCTFASKVSFFTFELSYMHVQLV